MISKSGLILYSSRASGDCEGSGGSTGGIELLLTRLLRVGLLLRFDMLIAS